MTVSDAIKLARRWWWVLIVFPVIAAIVAYVASSAMTPIYRAKATLLIQQSQTLGVQNYQDLLAAQQQTTTYAKLVTTRPVLSEAATQLGLSNPLRLADQISVSSVSNTQLVTVAVEDPNPQRAAEIANTVSHVFITQIEQQQQSLTGNSLSEIQRNLDQVKQQIDDTEAQIAQLKATPDAGTTTQSRISTLQQELTQFQTSYGSLLQAQQQMTISSSQVGAQVRVAEEAIAPSTPVRPRITLNTVLAGLLGLLIGVGVVAILGYFDNTVKSSEDLRELTGAGAIGAIPHVTGLNAEDVLTHPRSTATESFRSLRTNLQFAMTGKGFKVMSVTSTRPGDGKTTTSASLSILMAQAGQRVVLIDADLRKPRLHRQFNGLHNRSGLTNALRGPQVNVIELLQETQIPGLRILTSGPLPADSAETLYSPAFHQVLSDLRDAADLIVFDTPPVGLSDPFVIAGVVDGVLLVTWAGRARKNELTSALERIALSGTPIIGVILTHTAVRGDDYYYYYHAYDEPDAAVPAISTISRNGSRRSMAQGRRFGFLPKRSAPVEKQ